MSDRPTHWKDTARALASAQGMRTALAAARAGGFVTYLAYALVLCAALALPYLLRHRVMAFVDVGSDTFFQFYPVLLAELHQLRELHAITWSFGVGLGAFLGSCFDPIQLLAVLFPDSWQLAVRLPIYLFKLVLGGAFFFAWLRRVGFEPRLSALGALAFTFCGYQIVNAQWDPNGLPPVQLAAFLYCCESFLREGRKGFAVAAGLVVGLGQVFDLYTFALFAALYFAARPAFVDAAANRGYLRALLQFGIWGFAGVVLTAPIQLPNLHYLFDSPRVGGPYSITAMVREQMRHLNDGATIDAEIAGFFGKDLLGTDYHYHGWANYFEGPGFYVGILLVLCAPQLLAPGATRREKRMFLAAAILTAAYVLWPGLRFVVYGFGHLAFRISTLWISAGLIVVGLTGLRRALLSGTWRTGLWLAIAAILSALAAVAHSLAQFVNYMQLLGVLGFVLAYSLLLLELSNYRRPSLALGVLLPLFAAELLLFAAPAHVDRNAVGSDGKSTAGAYDDATVSALALIRARESGEFYRVEKTYDSVFLCDALVQGYHGIKSYFFHGASILRFVDAMELPRPIRGPNYIYAPMDRPKALDLLGVKYVLARDRRLDAVAAYAYVGSADGIHVYESRAAFGLGHVTGDVIGESEAGKLALPQRDDLLLRAVVLEDPAPVVQQLARLDREQPPARDGIAPGGSFRLVDDTRVQGDAYTPRAGVLVLSMPFDAGWRATVDGLPAPLFRADYGLTGLVLAQGSHALELRYTAPGRQLGFALAALSLLVLVGSSPRLRGVRETLADALRRAPA